MQVQASPATIDVVRTGSVGEAREARGAKFLASGPRPEALAGPGGPGQPFPIRGAVEAQRGAGPAARPKSGVRDRTRTVPPRFVSDPSRLVYLGSSPERLFRVARTRRLSHSSSHPLALPISPHTSTVAPVSPRMLVQVGRGRGVDSFRRRAGV